MAPKFGTSGLRGLVSELTDDLCATYTRAFLNVVAPARGLMVGRDLRSSSPRIAAAVARTAQSMGVPVVDLGELPTPALALAALWRRWPSIMVTGSHIPADRNGLKFYTARGEIAKAEEQAIHTHLGAATGVSVSASIESQAGAEAAYLARYAEFFGPDALEGLRVGIYEHSTVGRDLLGAAVTALGGTPVPFGRSAAFVPVDTEAVDRETLALLRQKANELATDAIISADGDADRPLLADADGELVAGDILGTLTAIELGADGVATPVSANGMIELTRAFRGVLRTKIGSPYVIAGIEDLRRTCARPVGFEPNGGFLLGFAAERQGRRLQPLMTRDALLPILCVLVAARRGGSVRSLVDGLPARRTATDRLQDVPTDRSAALVARLAGDGDARAHFFAGFGTERSIDQTDGLRITFEDGLVVHLRPSGNAPEFRIYAEAESRPSADAALSEAMARVAARLAGR